MSLARRLPAFLTSALRTSPSFIKYLAFFLLLLNARSLPLVWHLRVFRPVFWVRSRYLLLRCLLVFKSRANKEKAIDNWVESICPLGANPFERVVVYETRATIDDSDYNGHLSNSSYAKTLDGARFKAAIDMFPNFFRTGGWMALAATNYNFVREIPMLAKYEVRLSIGAWDNKWIYIISRFVTKSKTSSRKSPPRPLLTEQNDPLSGSEEIFNASLHVPIDELSIMSTPSADDTSSTSQIKDTKAVLKKVTANLVAKGEPDGAILHTIAVSQLCFKIGRLTVPPVLALAINGFCAPSTEEDALVYSRTNKPPHWARVQSLSGLSQGGSTKTLRNLLKGGWKDVPQDERWWDLSLGGTVEEQRRTRLEALEALRSGLERVRAF